MSQYPRDEFDKIPESASRQGVHRERLVPPRSSGLALKIIVGVLALAVGLAAYFIFPRLGIGEGADPASSLATSTPSSEAATSEPSPSPATDDETSGPSPSDSSPSAEPTEGEPVEGEPTDSEPSPSENPSAVDRTQPVNVFNSTGISGMASSAAGRVSGGGWTVGQIADWGGVPPQTSVIFYNNASQLAAAQELAGILGIPTLVETTEVSPDLTVVIGPGFQ